MKKRDWMFDFRAANLLSRAAMAKRIRKPGYWQCSEKLLECLEEDAGFVTHPDIAKAIAKEYHATKEQAELLLPANYRKSKPEYDPMRYVSNDE